MQTRILIIEDNMGLAKALKDRLQSGAYAIVVAPERDSGLKTAIRGAFNLVILETIPPAQSGLVARN